MHRLLDRHVQLEAELADVRDPHAQHARQADAIQRALRNGNAAVDRSVSVSDWSSARDRGPWTLSCAHAEVTSVATAAVARGAPHPRLDVAVRGVGGDDEEAASASLVTVTSASIVPASFNHGV